MTKLWLLPAAMLLAPVPRLEASDIIIQESRMQPTNDLALSDDGRFVVTLGMRGQLSVWDAHSGALLEALEGQPMSRSTDVAFTSDNRYVSYCNRQSVMVWDWLDRRIIWSSEEFARISAVAIDVSRRKIFAAEGNTLSQRSLGDGKELSRSPLGDVQIDTITLADKGKLSLLCKEKGILFFDPDTGELARGAEEKKQILKGSFSPLDRQTSPWLGETGKRLRLLEGNDGGQTVQVFNPSDSSKRDLLAISFPIGEVVTSLDTDRSGHVIAASTDKGWFCYDGDPNVPQSWKSRELQSAPPILPILSQHPDGKTLLYGSKSGAIGGITLEAGLPDRLLGRMANEVSHVTAFPDGKIMASTGNEHCIFSERQPPGLQGEGEIYASWPCRNFLLRNSPNAMIGNMEAEVVRSDGRILDSFTDKEAWPSVHPTKPLVMHFSRDDTKSRFRMGEITDEGRYSVLHQLEYPAEAEYLAIPESTGTFVLLSWDGLLHRVDALTGTRTKLRDGIPKEIHEAHLSPDGEFLAVELKNELHRFVLIPLDPGQPCVELSKTRLDFGIRMFFWIGFSGNQRGLWLSSKRNLLDDAPTYAGLWDTGSGQLVARVRIYENGPALILLPDGRCYFNQAANGLAMQRKAGQATLSPVESSPAVFEILAPYLGKN